MQGKNSLQQRPTVEKPFSVATSSESVEDCWKKNQKFREDLNMLLLYNLIY